MTTPVCTEAGSDNSVGSAKKRIFEAEQAGAADAVMVRRETAAICLRHLTVDVLPALRSAAEAPARTDYQREEVEVSRARLRGLESMISDLRRALS